MRAKKKRVLLVITLLLILAAVVVAMFQFTQSGYLTTVPYRSAFTEIASHVYINRNYAGDQQELFEMIEQAKDRVRTFFGDVRFQDETIFIICDDDKLTRKLGEDHGTVILYFPSETYYICISDEYLELDILAHEITHAELHTRLSAEAQKEFRLGSMKGLLCRMTIGRNTAKRNGSLRPTTGKMRLPLRIWTHRQSFMRGKPKTGVFVT